ncbi:MAG: tRNA threonylcarbamoyladenosine dehydratase [Oscillospiraceae bacterium]|nr:tRNA threonylcarbamoyladenosine dehydratase [Oscillospiraceae bacterium]
MPSPFSRSALLLGEDSLQTLAKARVIVFGVGGVGSYVAEALARGGVGAIDLVDDDVVSITNINRQLPALHSTVGQPKIDVMARRIRDIHPDCCVTTHPCFFSRETAGQFDFSAFSYIVDAVDTVSAKLLLVEQAYAAGTPIISSMGAGNKLDPTRFEVTDIFKTSVCPLARVMRQELRKRNIPSLKVVYSKEEARTPRGDHGETLPQGRRQLPGSVPFVPSVAGLILAGEVICDLTGTKVR